MTSLPQPWTTVRPVPDGSDRWLSLGHQRDLPHGAPAQQVLERFGHVVERVLGRADRVDRSRRHHGQQVAEQGTLFRRVGMAQMPQSMPMTERLRSRT